MKIINTLIDWIVSFKAPPAPPSVAVRNFLLHVEAEGGFLFEGDPLFEQWADEAHQASRLGLFVSEGGFAVGSRLTHKGERTLRQFRETDAVTLAPRGKGRGGAPGGLVLARKAAPNRPAP